MTPFRRMLARVVHSMANAYFEGPEPPARLAEAADAFVEAHPKATRAQFREALVSIARDSWRQGYARGWEGSQRDPAQAPPKEVPDAWSTETGEDGKVAVFRNGEEVVPETLEEGSKEDLDARAAQAREDWLRNRVGFRGP